MFEAALEAVANDVSEKVGEMERFMEMSENFMASIDLRNGIFEEAGLKTNLHAYGTNIEGEWDQVFSAVKRTIVMLVFVLYVVQYMRNSEGLTGYTEKMHWIISLQRR